LAAGSISGVAAQQASAATSFYCVYSPKGGTIVLGQNVCLKGSLAANNATGWGDNYWIYTSFANSNVSTLYLKGIRWLRSGTYYGPWWGGNGSGQFSRNTAGAVNVYQQVICFNGHTSASQIMQCMQAH
jgi:hypothetical protein